MRNHGPCSGDTEAPSHASVHPWEMELVLMCGRATAGLLLVVPDFSRYPSGEGWNSAVVTPMSQEQQQQQQTSIRFGPTNISKSLSSPQHPSENHLQSLTRSWLSFHLGGDSR